MNLPGDWVPAVFVRCQQSLLQHIREDALAFLDEIDAHRRRFPAKQAAQGLEVFPCKETRRGHVGDDPARPCEA